jgi:prepilin-type N-terminal cleavage/methylation domain-containing protein/prepilin-type processing-associated H-X9-DG protein
MRRRIAFTLVELLVVIAIIAILIAILLPVLGSVRRQAQTVKCAAAMRELGNAYLFYAQENKGYLPAPRIGYAYNIDSLLFDAGQANDIPGQVIAENAHWYDLIAKYIAKGRAATPQSPQELANITNSVIRGCPAFFQAGDAPTNPQNAISGTNRLSVGYGMNWWPLAGPNVPALGTDFPTPANKHNFDINASGSAGRWFKLSEYKQATDRALLADARWWYIESRAPAANGTFVGQRLNYYPNLYTNATLKQTTFDFYRHGAYPPIDTPAILTGQYSATGGKVAFNVLFCDNHVATMIDRASAYRVVRMRYPQ